MKNAFTYKNLEDIAGDCKKRGLPIRFEKHLDILYEPVEVGGRKAGNRLAIHPMEGSDASADGKPGELTFRRWKRFGSGGAKIIWGEAAAVAPEGRSNPHQLMMRKENSAELAELVKQTRHAHREKFGIAADLLIGIQLTHAGRQCSEKPFIAFHSPVHDSFGVPGLKGKPIPADYPIASDDYLKSLEDAYLEAARVAKDAGFDFVDIKQCHSYLPNELLAARSRPGDYGGSLKNRRRFIFNVVRRIRETLGDEILVASRLNVYDGVPHKKDSKTGEGAPVAYEIPYVWGWGADQRNPQKEDLSEPKKLVEALSSLGVAMFSISVGSPYWSPHLVRPFNKPVTGEYLSPEHPLVGVYRHFRLTDEMQRAFPIVPMLGAGYSWLRQFLLNAAAANIAEGGVAIAGVGRTAFAYPDFAADGRERGTLNSRKVCLADSMCSNMLRAWTDAGEKVPAGCPVRDSKYKPFCKELK
ncbi:NADH:flavin oxidoreductase [Candidatus Poribacteria bacterium]|nr:NADH:flavin oxidoreductase [Candidatus Poribacteria bacterium]